ncbi:unnamed protein product, partial [Oppiella nova]
MVCPEHQVFDGRQSCIDTFRCPLYDGDFTNPNNRHQYYQCLNSKPYLKTCLSGCPEHHPGKFKHPSSQNLYYECWEGIAITKSCGDGRHEYYECRNDVPLIEVFDETVGQCVETNRRALKKMVIISGRIEFDDNGVKVVDVWDNVDQWWKRTYDGGPLIILVSCETWVIRGTTIRPANEYPFVCPQPDGYSPHPYNSSQYYLCRNGNSYLMTCPADTVFDGRQTCIDAFRCPQYDGNFTIANNRRQYYQCTNGRHVLMTCSYGTYFDELTRRCITGGRDDRDREPDYVSCPKEEDRFAHPSNQSQYYECHSGRYVLRSCPYGLYYDEQAQYCIRFGNQFYCPQPNG